MGVLPPVPGYTESMPSHAHPHLPSEVPGEIGVFDQFAGWAAGIASRAPFFAFCLLLVVVWLLQGLVIVLATRSFHSFLDDKYQLEINTTTTIITFLMVALLQNSQTRSDHAVQHKLNAIADGLADLMTAVSASGVVGGERLDRDIAELKQAVGLEDRESTTKHAGPVQSAGHG